MLNKKLLLEIADHVESHPEQYDQETWVGRNDDNYVPCGPGKHIDPYDCGTSACIAGWAVLLSNKPVPVSFQNEAAKLLGLSSSDAATLFDENWCAEGYDIRLDDEIQRAKYAADALRRIAAGESVDDVTDWDEGDV